MTELHDLLNRAVDRLENPRLEQAAWEIARRRRTRRRGALAATAASVLAVAVVVGMPGGDGARDASPAPSRTPTTTPSNPPPTSEPPTPEPPTSDAKVWPEWDPRDVDQLPAAPDRIAPDLPDVIEPPASSPLLSDDPLPSAAVLAVERDGVAQVLGVSGEWRTVPIDGRYPFLSLSPDGTRLAIDYYYDSRTPEHDYGATVHHLATGTVRTIDPPQGFEPWDNTGWSFLTEDRLLLVSGPRAYGVSLDTGEAEQLPVPFRGSMALDPEGNWLSSADFDQPNVLSDYAGGAPRDLSMDRTGRLLHLQADMDTVVGTTYDGRPFSVVVADRETLTPQVVLPVHDHDANYSNWGLGVAAIAEDGTVLLRVAAIGRRVDGFRLVAWDPTTGDLSIVSSTAVPVEGAVVFARSALRAVDPG